MSKKTGPETRPEHVQSDNTAARAPRAILGAAAGFAIGLIPIGFVMVFVFFIRFYDCGYSTACPSSSFTSWYIPAGFIGSALIGGLIGGRLRFRSDQTEQAAFQGGRRGAVLGEILFAVAYVVTLIWTTR